MTSGAEGEPGSLMRWFVRAHWSLRFLIAAALGVAAAFGQAPFYQPLALIFALAFGFGLWRAARSAQEAAMLGWAFGVGYFGLALVWIMEPFQVDAGRHGWMAPFALVFMSAGLALFWGGAFGAARRLSSRAFTLVLAWSIAEVLRAYVLTGFPWVSPAQVLTDGPASRLLAWVGPHGANLCLLALAWLVSLPAAGAARASVRLGQGALLFAATLGIYLPLAFAPADLTGYVVRLVQPNAAQHLKWQPQMAEVFYQRQLDFTAARGSQQPDLIVWPETAIPWRLESAEPALQQIAQAARGTPVVLGLLRTSAAGVHNSAVALDAQGHPVQVYDKHHLVPFGEYFPGAAWAASLGLTGLASNGIGFAAGPGPELIDLGPLGRALPLICYEAVFPQDVNAAPERPNFLLHLTNDAWFGAASGPQQHLAQARMRAIEQGLPVLRAANTGISAMIDPLGRVTDQLPLGVAGVIDAPLPQPLPPTFYARTGDLPIIVLLCLGLMAQIVQGLRSRRAQSD